MEFISVPLQALGCLQKRERRTVAREDMRSEGNPFRMPAWCEARGRLVMRQQSEIRPAVFRDVPSFARDGLAGGGKLLDALWPYEGGGRPVQPDSGELRLLRLRQAQDLAERDLRRDDVEEGRCIQQHEPCRIRAMTMEAVLLCVG